MKKIILIFLFIFFSYFHIVNALEITEVMYDVEGTDTDREWIEIYNNQENSIDISTYKLFEANINHGLTLVQGEKNLSKGSYAVIVQNKDKFKIDYPSFSGIIFDSSFSLSNEGEIFSIKDGNLNVLDQVNYNVDMGANGDGKSLQKINNTMQSAIPTPGAMNTGTINYENNSNNTELGINTNNSNTDNTSSNISVSLKENKITTEILTTSFGFVKNPLEIKAQTLNSNGEKIFYGKYFFNFNDGNGEEYTLNSFDKILYTYKYPGEYLIHLSYYLNSYDTVPQATDKFLVKILDTGIFISNVGDEKDFFVEIKNNTNYENDISNWYISALDKKFIFPKNSFISANGKIILSPENTGFVFSDNSDLKLYNSSGNLVFDYGILLQAKNKTKSSQNSKNNLSSMNTQTKSMRDNLEEDKNISTLFDLNSVNSENLQANSINILDENNQKENFYFYLLGLCVLIISAVFTVLFLRKKEKKIVEDDDFEILE